MANFVRYDEMSLESVLAAGPICLGSLLGTASRNVARSFVPVRQRMRCTALYKTRGPLSSGPHDRRTYSRVGGRCRSPNRREDRQPGDNRCCDSSQPNDLVQPRYLVRSSTFAPGAWILIASMPFSALAFDS